MTTTEALLSTFDVDELAIEALLFQTGYLTIAGEKNQGGRIRFRLGYPNFEVRQNLNERLLAALLPDAARSRADDAPLRELLAADDFQGLEAFLRSLFAGIPHQWHVRNDVGAFEGYYASVAYSCFAAHGLDLTAEDSSSTGRSDMGRALRPRRPRVRVQAVQGRPGGHGPKSSNAYRNWVAASTFPISRKSPPRLFFTAAITAARRAFVCCSCRRSRAERSPTLSSVVLYDLLTAAPTSTPIARFFMSFSQGLLAVLLVWAAGIAHVLLTTDTPLPDALESGAGLGTAALLVILLIALPAGFLAGGMLAVVRETRCWLLPRPVDPAQERNRLVRPAMQVRETESPNRRDRRREDMGHKPHALPQRRRRRQRRSDDAYCAGGEKNPASAPCSRA